MLGDVAVVVVFVVGEQYDVVLVDASVAQLGIVLLQMLELGAIDELVAEDVDAEHNDCDCSDSKQSFVCLADSTAQQSLWLKLGLGLGQV